MSEESRDKTPFNEHPGPVDTPVLQGDPDPDFHEDDDEEEPSTVGDLVLRSATPDPPDSDDEDQQLEWYNHVKDCFASAGYTADDIKDMTEDTYKRLWSLVQTGRSESRLHGWRQSLLRQRIRSEYGRSTLSSDESQIQFGKELALVAEKARERAATGRRESARRVEELRKKSGKIRLTATSPEPEKETRAIILQEFSDFEDLLIRTEPAGSPLAANSLSPSELPDILEESQLQNTPPGYRTQERSKSEDEDSIGNHDEEEQFDDDVFGTPLQRVSSHSSELESFERPSNPVGEQLSGGRVAKEPDFSVEEPDSPGDDRLSPPRGGHLPQDVHKSLTRMPPAKVEPGKVETALQQTWRLKLMPLMEELWQEGRSIPECWENKFKSTEWLRFHDRWRRELDEVETQLSIEKGKRRDLADFAEEKFDTLERDTEQKIEDVKRKAKQEKRALLEADEKEIRQMQARLRERDLKLEEARKQESVLLAEVSDLKERNRDLGEKVGNSHSFPVEKIVQKIQQQELEKPKNERNVPTTDQVHKAMSSTFTFNDFCSALHKEGFQFNAWDLAEALLEDKVTSDMLISICEDPRKLASDPAVRAELEQYKIECAVLKEELEAARTGELKRRAVEQQLRECEKLGEELRKQIDEAGEVIKELTESDECSEELSKTQEKLKECEKHKHELLGMLNGTQDMQQQLHDSEDRCDDLQRKLDQMCAALAVFIQGYQEQAQEHELEKEAHLKKLQECRRNRDRLAYMLDDLQDDFNNLHAFAVQTRDLCDRFAEIEVDSKRSHEKLEECIQSRIQKGKRILELESLIQGYRMDNVVLRNELADHHKIQHELEQAKRQSNVDREALHKYKIQLKRLADRYYASLLKTPEKIAQQQREMDDLRRAHEEQSGHIRNLLNARAEASALQRTRRRPLAEGEKYIDEHYGIRDDETRRQELERTRVTGQEELRRLRADVERRRIDREMRLKALGLILEE